MKKYLVPSLTFFVLAASAGSALADGNYWHHHDGEGWGWGHHGGGWHGRRDGGTDDDGDGGTATEPTTVDESDVGHDGDQTN